MAETNEKVTKDFVDHSYFYRPYMVLVVIAFILWGAYVCWTGYWGFIVNHRVPVIDLGMQVAILWWLLDTVLTKTVYRLEKDRLYMLKTGVGHKKELSIPYEDIFGVHHFKNQLMKPVTYRYTFHEYAKLDNRPIWSLLYDIGSDKKVGRVLMKASEEFWKEFERRMPGQIRIPQEEVVTFTYKAMEKKLRDQGYFKEHPEMSFYPKTYIFGAKASAGYIRAKEIIKLINSVADVINNVLRGRYQAAAPEGYGNGGP